jgi:hypothetical protein
MIKYKELVLEKEISNEEQNSNRHFIH